jgi:hypothetical protein
MDWGTLDTTTGPSRGGALADAASAQMAGDPSERVARMVSESPAEQIGIHNK